MALRRDYMQNKWKINLAYHIFEHKGTPCPSLLESLAIVCWSWLILAHESVLIASFPIFISSDTLVAWNQPLWEHLPHGNQQFVFHCWKPIVKHSLAHHCLTGIHSSVNSQKLWLFFHESIHSYQWRHLVPCSFSLGKKVFPSTFTSLLLLLLLLLG